MAAKIFIDGEVGTTGLQIRRRLEGRDDIALISLPEADRKNPSARRSRLNEADLVVLCLPDEAARQAVAMIDNPAVKVIDASTAHRTDPNWVYGLPELAPGHDQRVAEAKRVANPGCYPSGAIALIRPLVDEGLLPSDWPVTVNAISGYSGGGRKMIESYEDPNNPDPIESPYRLYALGLQHKHVPEMQLHGGLTHPPLFVPSVGKFRQGMIVQVPLQLWALPGAPSLAQVHRTLAQRYAGSPVIDVAPLEDSLMMSHLDPEGFNGTNGMRLYAFGNPDEGQVLLAAVLDNSGQRRLGRGGSESQHHARFGTGHRPYRTPRGVTRAACFENTLNRSPSVRPLYRGRCPRPGGCSIGSRGHAQPHRQSNHARAVSGVRPEAYRLAQQHPGDPGFRSLGAACRRPGDRPRRSASSVGAVLSSRTWGKIRKSFMAWPVIPGARAWLARRRGVLSSGCSITRWHRESRQSFSAGSIRDPWWSPRNWA